MNDWNTTYFPDQVVSAAVIQQQTRQRIQKGKKDAFYLFGSEEALKHKKEGHTMYKTTIVRIYILLP